MKIEKKTVFLSSLIFGIFCLLTLYTFTLGAGRRASDVGLFNGALEAQAEMRLKAINSGTNPAIARLLYNKFVVAGIRFYYNHKTIFYLSSSIHRGRS
jgi:hypothetical protein